MGGEAMNMFASLGAAFNPLPASGERDLCEAVMRGLDPRIHVDGRIKTGHDACLTWTYARYARMRACA